MRLEPSAHASERPYRLTNSEMGTWTRCRRKWMLGHHLGFAVPERGFNVPLSIGTRMHEALAIVYDPSDDRAPMDVLDAGIAADLEKNPAAEADILKEADLCRAMLEGYLLWLEETGADSELELLSAETAVEVKLNDDVNILSKIDARVRRKLDGVRGALEHKTAGSVKGAMQMLQIDKQLLTEHLAEYLSHLARGEEGRMPEFVIRNTLRKVKRTAAAKPPFYGREEVEHNIHELRNHWTHVSKVSEEIVTAHAQLAEGIDHHYVCPSTPLNNRCEWECDFIKVCGLMDDGSDWESAVEDIYERVDPLERYSDHAVRSLVMGDAAP